MNLFTYIHYLSLTHTFICTHSLHTQTSALPHTHTLPYSTLFILSFTHLFTPTPISKHSVAHSLTFTSILPTPTPPPTPTPATTHPLPLPPQIAEEQDSAPRIDTRVRASGRSLGSSAQHLEAKRASRTSSREGEGLRGMWPPPPLSLSLSTPSLSTSIYNLLTPAPMSPRITSSV